MKKPDIELKNAQNVGAKGVHIISLCKITTERATRLQKQIEDVRKRRTSLLESGRATFESLRILWEEYNYFLSLLHKGFLVRQRVVENVTATVGRAVLAQRLAAITTYTGTVNYGALGTSNTAPAVGNTQLGAETYRKALSSGTAASNIAYLENFYTSSEVSGTFEEYGFFIDGTGSANSGQLFNRFTTTTVKSNVESLNVQSTITISDV